jgi:GTP cyclohydrolase FolE2
MSRFKELVEAVIEENRTSLLDMEDSEVQRLVDEIAKAKKVQVYDFTVKLRGQINPGNPSEIPSVQPMAAFFELAVFLF